MILAIFALSLDLLVGYTGLVSFGHAAFYGVGAYTLGLMAPKYEAASLWLTLPAAMLAAGLAALVVGVFVVRVKGIYFIMVTLAFAQMFYFVFHDTKFGRGSDGISMNFKPVADDRRLHAVRPRQRDARLLLRARRCSSPCSCSCAWCCARRSAARCRESAATSTGCARSASPSTGTSSRASRWPARSPGLAGYLSALQFGFVNPELLSWHQSGNVLLMLILGGVGSLYGAVVGAFAFVALPEIFQSLTTPLAAAAGRGDHPAGDLPAGRARERRRAVPAHADRGRATMTEADPRDAGPDAPLRRARRRRAAWRSRSSAASCTPCSARTARARRRSSTCCPATSRRSSGSITYKGEDITRQPADRRSRIGIGRSYQKTNIFPAFTAFENCRLAAQSRTPRALHLFADADGVSRRSRAAAERALDAAGLAGRGDRVASALSHGEQRQLEIAMVLATQPEVLLLDEPLAGMGAEEAALMVELLRKLAPRARDPARRARHGRGVRRRRRDHRDGQRAGARKRPAGADPRERRRAARRISARTPRRRSRATDAGSAPSDGDERMAARGARAAHLLRCEPHPARHRLPHRPRRDGRADGPQRHGQEHADPQHARARQAAPRRGPGARQRR